MRARRSRGRRGVSMVEFAILAPLAFTLLLGVFDFARAGYDNGVVNNGAREGVRAAIPSRESSQSLSAWKTDIASAISRTLGGGIALDTTAHDGTGISGCPSVSVTPGKATFYVSPFSSLPSGHKAVTVTVCYTFTPWVPLVNKFFNSGNGIVLGSSEHMTAEY